MVKKLPFERSELPTEDVAPFLVLLPISVLIEVLAVPDNSGLTKGFGSYRYVFYVPTYGNAQFWVPLDVVCNVMIHLKS